VIHRAEVFTSDDYHFVIFKDGTIKTIVPLAERGAHAIAFNGTTIAIAVFGDFAALEPGLNNHPTQQQLDTCIALMRSLNAMYGNALWAAGHSQLGPTATDVPSKLVYGHTCPGENFPLADVISKSGCKTYKP
jgi:N-acetyl-anhydromuramyl-L-alanine amidase AmpD